LFLLIKKISVIAFPNRTSTNRVVARLNKGKLNGEIHSLKNFDSVSQSAALPAILFESFKFGSRDVPSIVKKTNNIIKNILTLIIQIRNREGRIFFGFCVIRHIPFYLEIQSV